MTGAVADEVWSDHCRDPDLLIFDVTYGAVWFEHAALMLVDYFTGLMQSCLVGLKSVSAEYISLLRQNRMRRECAIMKSNRR